MGTNYYAVKNRPTTTDPIHIGKSSAGWRFNFQAHNDTWNEPPIIWNTFEQVRDWLKKYTVDTQDYVIMNEYDEIVPFDKLMELIANKQTSDNPDNFTYSRNVNGYRFVDDEFC